MIFIKINGNDKSLDVQLDLTVFKYMIRIFFYLCFKCNSKIVTESLKVISTQASYFIVSFQIFYELLIILNLKRTHLKLLEKYFKSNVV